MNQHRIDKCQVLFELAQQADGIIVELGTFRGMSAIALDWGSNHTVYTIDNWDNIGWAKEVYSIYDREMAEVNLKSNTSDVHIVNGEISEVAKVWDKSDKISLLFWDTGVEDCLVKHWSLWSKHIKKGGLFLVHDTEDCRLGWNELKSMMTDKWPAEEYPPLHGLRRL